MVLTIAHRWVLGRRDSPPDDILTVNTALAEDPLRRLSAADQKWAGHTLSTTKTSPVEEIANLLMTHVSKWLPRSQISIPPELAHVIRGRILQSVSGQDKDFHTADWLLKPPGIACAPFQNRIETGWGDALPLLAILRSGGATSSRARIAPSPAFIGEYTQRADYSSQYIGVGHLHWAGIDFGGQFPINDHLRTPLSYKKNGKQPACGATSCGILLVVSAGVYPMTASIIASASRRASNQTVGLSRSTPSQRNGGPTPIS